MDALFAGYVAGTLAEPARILVRSHLEISPVNRGFIRDLEAFGGDMLEEMEPVEISGREAKLKAIFADKGFEDVSPKKVAPRQCSDILPNTLRDFLGYDLKDVPWRSRLPGMKEYKLGEIDGCNVSMLWIRAGMAMPTHTHHGTELTLVLEGGFSDGIGHFVRGDVSFADESVDHKPVADDDGDCICFAVTEGNLQLTGPVGRFFAPFIRG
ncbi:ChrR family anti-sigma-E factor [Hongsoonwoonella zoysiae]|uniref:ChrR family anti-sigma-E factor n=1 Tax=Hongsoonwoonella zoysiae TaxID=2821844 RepID=UPI001FEBB9B4|nr:ChrR family anti-sigma-E factor [Hongsoonwoonella zoysiae]